MPRGFPVFFTPQLNQEQFVPEVGQILQRLQAIHIIDEIGKAIPLCKPADCRGYFKKAGYAST